MNTKSPLFQMAAGIVNATAALHREQDPDDLWDQWFRQQERNGKAVIDRQEWRDKLVEAARDGYAEGRKDERESFLPALRQVRSALKEAERLLERVYALHSVLDDGDGEWVDLEATAERMSKAVEALDDAVGAI